MSVREAVTAMALGWFYQRTPALDLAVRRWRDGRPAMLHPARRPWQANLDRAAAERLLLWLRHENSQGADIYVRPARGFGSHSLVFLDDLTPALAARVADKYAALAVATSAGSAQAWIAVTCAMAEAERLVVQRALAAACHADPGSVSGEHFGRLPGFVNRKPSHPDHPWVSVLVATDGEPLDPAPYLIESEPRERVQPVPYRHASSGNHAGDESARDWYIARRGVETGMDRVALVGEIAGRAHARGKRSTASACIEYARRTVERAARLT